MSSIDIFTRIQLPQEEVFNYLINPHTLSRCASPFFKLENLRSSNLKIDSNTYFSQKFVFSDFLQLFYTVKEVTSPKKILFNFEGLIKGSDCMDIISDDGSSILKEKIDFSL